MTDILAFIQSHLLTTLVVLPLAGAVLALLTPGRGGKVIALATGTATFLLSAWMLTQFEPAAGMQFTEFAEWLPAFNIHYHMAVDGISLPLLVLNCLLTLLCLVFSWNFKSPHHQNPSPSGHPTPFLSALLVLEAAVNGTFAAQDFILFYVSWESMLIPMFLIIGLWGGENRVYATVKFFLYTFVGSVMMLVGGLWLYSYTGSFSFAEWQMSDLPFNAQLLLFAAFFSAFAVKVPMWPFHTWLPDAHVQAPTAGSVILAGVLLKMGIYGFLRISLPVLPEATQYAAPALFILSTIAVIYGALVAYAQTDIKRMIAYSSVSHMGIATLALFSGTQAGIHGALMVMINHGIISAGLFLAVGVIYERMHTRELSRFGNLADPMPKYAFVMMILTLGAMAVPGSNSFVGEFLALSGSFPVAPVCTAIATASAVFVGMYMLHLYRGMFFTAAEDPNSKTLHPTPHTLHPQKDLSLRESLVFLPLLVLIPLLGLQPNLLMNLWQPQVEYLAPSAVPAAENRDDSTSPAPETTPTEPDQPAAVSPTTPELPPLSVPAPQEGVTNAR